MPIDFIADEEEEVVSEPRTNSVTLPQTQPVILPPQFTPEDRVQYQAVTGAGQSYFDAQRRAEQEEQARLAQEEAIWQAAVNDPANQVMREPTLRQRIRGSEPVTRLLGPVPVEREVQREMGLGVPAIGDIAETALKFTGTAPPPIAEPIRAWSDPAINLIPNETARGVARGGRELAMSVPGIIASGGLLPAHPAVLAAFGGQAVWQLPEQKEAFDRARKAGNDAEAAQIATETFGMGALLTGGAALGGAQGRLRPEVIDPTQARDIALQLSDPRQAQRRVVLPQSMREAARPPAMPARAAEPAAVPARAPEPAPVKPAAEKPAEPAAEIPEAAETLPEQFRTKPVADTVELVKGVTPEEMAAYKGSFVGGPTGFMWDLGAKAKTVEDVAALRKMAEEASAETKALMKAGDLEGAMKVIGRQPAEAYEFATGVKLDGTPKWSVLEKLAADRGQTYRPPVPDLQYLKAKGLESAPVPEPAKSGPPDLAPAPPAPPAPAAEPLPNNLPALARLRIRKPELREQIDAKIAELHGAAAPAAAVLKGLPPVPAGHVRLFHGEGGPKGGGTGGAFYTSNVAKASTFGPDVSWVDLPTAKAQAAYAKAKESAFPGGDNFVLEAADIQRAQKINQKVEQPTHVLDEPAATPSEAPKKFQDTGPGSPADEYGAIYGPKLPPEAAAKFRENAGESVDLPSPEPGVTITAQFKGNKIWVQADRPVGKGSEVEQSVAYLHVRNDGTTVLNASRHGRPLDEMAKKALTDFLGKMGGEKRAKATEVGRPQIESPKGIAAAVRKPGALEGGGETGAISLVPLQNLVRQAAPSVKAAVDAVKAISRGAVETGKEAISTERMTDYRRSVLNWSAKLQKSFDEAASAQKDIQTRVPNPVRREGITNWLQANGDAAVLRQRMIATADPKLKAGYQAALNLTPEELTVANRVRQLYDSYGQRGQASDVLDNFKENYVTQIWDLGKSRPGGSSSRTLKERFKFSKASTFPTFFDGEQAGYVPKTKDISKLLPVYVHEMNSVIAARQLVEQMSRGRASDGRPLVAPRGTAEVVAGSTTGPTLVMPDRIKGDTADYKVLGNQPALHAWRWASKDSAGNPIFLKGDLALHPEAFDKLKNVLGRSAIREWYSTPGSRVAAIPKGIVRGLDAFNSETKRTMLGMLAPFHQVQTGTHAVGHRVNPFGNIPKIDLVGDRLQMDAARHGLMLLPDRVSEGQFMEGFKTSGIISKIPGLGPLSDMYANYLFKQYIPGLKFKTYEAIVKRNREVYADELRAGTMKPEDVKVLSAEQANAAYGHLNYADLARNPTFQHMAQIGLLAPDFLEARGRFAGQAAKGATGAKVGREQMIALATLAVAQAAASFVSAKLSGGEWDADHPFEFHVGSRKYTMRSVPEDISGLIHNTRTFVHSRLSPIVGKGTLQYLSGVDYAGRRVTAGETTKELLTQPLPITARSLPGIRSVSGQDRPGSIEAWEQLAGAVGLKISRYNPRTKINELHADWMKNSKDPKVQADYEQSQTATYPVSKYKSLDSALADRNEPAAVKAINQLIEEGQKPRDILRRMRPFVGEGINSRQKPLFHESHKMETDFRNSLKPEELAEYKLALEERRLVYQEFLKAWRKRGIAVSAPAPELDFVPDAGQ